MSQIHTPRYNKYYDLKNVVYKAWGDLMKIDTTGAAPGTSSADGQKVTGQTRGGSQVIGQAKGGSLMSMMDGLSL